MKLKPTIAIVANDVGPNGGMEKHLSEMIMRLKQDMNVIVVATTLELSKEDLKGVRFIRVPVIRRPAPIRMLMFALVASIFLLFIKRDILHTTGAIVWNKADVSTVHFCHVGYHKESSVSRIKKNPSILKRWNSWLAALIAKYMEKRQYRPNRTKILVSVSNRVRDECLDNFPYNKTQVIVIPNGVDLEVFRPYNYEEKEFVREKLGLPAGATIMLFMGGDWPRKGLEYVIDAFNKVGMLYQHLHLVVVGRGDAERYKSKVEEKFYNRVHFVGIQQHPEYWFGASDLFVFPSDYETFSLVVHEAAAMGLVILTTKVGGVEDLIKENVNGFYIKRDSNDIAIKLTKVLREWDKHRKLGILAREGVSRLTWDETYNKFMNIYTSIQYFRNEGTFLPLGELRRSQDE